MQHYSFSYFHPAGLTSLPQVQTRNRSNATSQPPGHRESGFDTQLGRRSQHPSSAHSVNILSAPLSAELASPGNLSTTQSDRAGRHVPYAYRSAKPAATDNMPKRSGGTKSKHAWKKVNLSQFFYEEQASEDEFVSESPPSEARSQSISRVEHELSRMVDFAACPSTRSEQLQLLVENYRQSIASTFADVSGVAAGERVTGLTHNPSRTQQALYTPGSSIIRNIDTDEMLMAPPGEAISPRTKYDVAGVAGRIEKRLAENIPMTRETSVNVPSASLFVDGQPKMLTSTIPHTLDLPVPWHEEHDANVQSAFPDLTGTGMASASTASKPRDSSLVQPSQHSSITRFFGYDQATAVRSSQYTFDGSYMQQPGPNPPPFGQPLAQRSSQPHVPWNLLNGGTTSRHQIVDKFWGRSGSETNKSVSVANRLGATSHLRREQRLNGLSVPHVAAQRQLVDAELSDMLLCNTSRRVNEEAHAASQASAYLEREINHMQAIARDGQWRAERRYAAEVEDLRASNFSDNAAAVEGLALQASREKAAGEIVIEILAPALKRLETYGADTLTFKQDRLSGMASRQRRMYNPEPGSSNSFLDPDSDIPCHLRRPQDIGPFGLLHDQAISQGRRGE